MNIVSIELIGDLFRDSKNPKTLFSTLPTLLESLGFSCTHKDNVVKATTTNKTYTITLNPDSVNILLVMVMREVRSKHVNGGVNWVRKKDTEDTFEQEIKFKEDQLKEMRI